jgi:hypothetical protein
MSITLSLYQKPDDRTFMIFLIVVVALILTNKVIGVSRKNDTEVIIQEVFSFICYSIGVSTVAKRLFLSIRKILN